MNFSLDRIYCIVRHSISIIVPKSYPFLLPTLVRTLKLPPLLRAVAALACLALGTPGCSTQEPDFIQPPTAEQAPLSTAQLLRWYEAQAGSLKTESTASQAATPATAPALEWALATTTRVGAEHVTLVPFAGLTDQFDGSGYHGHRRLLIVQKARQQPKAAIIEVLATAPYAPAAAETLFLDLYRKGKTNAVLPQTTFTGFVFFYTLRYEPRAGKGYVQGRVVPGNPNLFHSGGPAGNKGGNTAQRVSTCTYTIISHSPPYTVSVCSGGGGGGGSSFGGGNDSGGYGNGPRPADYPEIPGDGDLNGDGDDGSTGTASVEMIFSGPVVNPAQELRCFNATQGATITIYVQQAVPNTSELNGGPYGVGHTFVGIEQNGITRYMGYYPLNGANQAMIALGSNYPGQIRDNSGETYHVSISAPVSGTQLSGILTYINTHPSTYNLNSYNCSDFGIAVGNLAGMNLPATTTSAMFNMFNGRSPGVLGQDIRSMNAPAGGAVNVNGGVAPSKQGTCP
jgi:hypothetical protein